QSTCAPSGGARERARSLSEVDRAITGQAGSKLKNNGFGTSAERFSKLKPESIERRRDRVSDLMLAAAGESGDRMIIKETFDQDADRAMCLEIAKAQPGTWKLAAEQKVVIRR